MGRRDEELLALARVAADETQPVMDRAAAVLTSHQRLDYSGCICGWDKLGRSYALHQAEQLEAAGLLVGQHHE